MCRFRDIRVIASCVLLLVCSALPGPRSAFGEFNVGEFTAALEHAAQQRKADAAQQRQRLLQSMPDQTQRVAYLRQWVSPTQQLAGQMPVRKGAAPALERLLAARQRAVMQMTHAPHEARVMIANGRVLNTLLDLCGRTAIQRIAQRNRRSMLPPDQELAELEKFSDDLSLRKLEPKWLREVRYVRGGIGPKLSGRLQVDLQGTDLRVAADPLDMEWPRVLRTDAYKSARNSFDRLRRKALKELETGPVGPETAAQLLVEVEDLRKRVGQEKMQYVRKGCRAAMPYYTAERHVEALSQATYQFVAATRREQVVGDPATVATIEEFIAYMHHNQLRFADAGEASGTAYLELAEAMFLYFSDIQRIGVAYAEAQGRLDEMKDRERMLQELEDGTRVSDLEKVLMGLGGLQIVFD